MTALLAARPVAAEPAAAPPPADEKLIQAFRSLCAARAEAAGKADTMTVVGKDGWLFFAGELRHVGAGKFWGEEAAKVSKASKPEWADPLPVILDFKAQLDKAGIELLLVPVPPKAIVYPDMLGDPAAAEKAIPRRLDAAHQEFYKLLKDEGVQVVDLAEPFLAARAQAGGKDLYCRQDTHWSPHACELTAGLLAERIKDRPWLKDVPRRKFDSRGDTLEITGDLLRGLGDPKPAKEKLPLRFVGVSDGGLLGPVEPSKESPVILLGDSHDLVFHAGGDMHCSGAGLADQLAMELGFAVDLIGVRGSGATPARMNLYQRSSDPKYLAGKKLVIWCFSAREFTESQGWRKLPIQKQAPPAQ